MSETIPIQTTSRDELPGGANETRRGNEHNQVFPLSGRSGVNVESSSTQQNPVAPNNENGAASRPSESVSGISVTGRSQERAKPVDFRTIAGSYAGDHRGDHSDTAKAPLNKAADNGGPRKPVGQFANNGKTPQTSGFKPYPTADNGD